MQALIDRIRSEGKILPGNILKVDGFLNQMIDTALLDEMGREFARLFASDGVTKILTVEASGISIACAAAFNMGRIPAVFAKKHSTLNQDPDSYSARVFSYTHGTEYTIRVAKRFISPDDRILLIDDFLANGEALGGMLEIIRQAGAEAVGAGIAIEKGFQEGGERLRAQGLRIESLAIIESMDGNSVTFRS
ncbi:MAG: xanthine phosphoribosyltransferase [Eubacteriaceae bacterium]|nr:xanthine phosphoribosyltransferase [Eubacteriaceae bacterium]